MIFICDKNSEESTIISQQNYKPTYLYTSYLYLTYLPLSSIKHSCSLKSTIESLKKGLKYAQS